MRKLWHIATLLIVIGLVLLVLGSAWPGVQVNTWPYVALEIAKGLGIAFFVAGVLSVTVDAYFKRRAAQEEAVLRERISADVFHAVLRQNFPEPIFEQIRAHLLTNPFLRANYKIIASMEPHEGTNYLKAIVTQEYELIRLAERECTYHIDAYLDRETLPGVSSSAQFLTLKVQSDDGHILDLYDATNISQLLDDSDPKLIRLRKSIDMSEHSCLRVQQRAELYYKREDYHIWMMTHMTTNVSVQYYAPSDLEFEFSANHPSGHLFTEFNDSMTHKYEFTGGLLPYQGVTVWWHPRVEQPEADTQG